MECEKPRKVRFQDSSPDPNRGPNLYPEVPLSNPDAPPVRKPEPSAPSLYPSLDMKDLVEDLFPENPTYHRNPPQNHFLENPAYYKTPPENEFPANPTYIPPENQFHDSEPMSPSAPPEAAEQVLIKIPGAIVNLIDKEYSVELASGDFSIVQLVQGNDAVAILARVDDDIQWPLLKDEGVVKLDDSHYFFSLYAPDEDPESAPESGKDEKKSKKKDGKKRKSNVVDADSFLNYGLTIASKGQESLVKELDEVLKSYCSFSVQKVSENAKKMGEALDSSLALDTAPAEMNAAKKKEMEEKSAAYWTTLAPNVEDYNGTAAKYIAAGTGQLIRGILWCGDVTVERLRWGNEVMKKRMEPGSNKEVSPQTLRRLKRAKNVSKMTQKVAASVLSGVLKVSGYFTGAVVNSKFGKKFFRLLPGEIMLAGLDGFCKVCDAVEVAGKNVMETSSTVTTELVSHKYGEEAGKAAGEGLDAAGHALGTAWTVFKIRQALNPKSAFKSTSLAKAAAKAKADEVRAKKK